MMANAAPKNATADTMAVFIHSHTRLSFFPARYVTTKSDSPRLSTWIFWPVFSIFSTSSMTFPTNAASFPFPENEVIFTAFAFASAALSLLWTSAIIPRYTSGS